MIQYDCDFLHLLITLNILIYYIPYILGCSLDVLHLTSRCNTKHSQSYWCCKYINYKG